MASDQNKLKGGGADAIDHLFTDILTDPDPVQRLKRTEAAYKQVAGILARLSFAEFVQQAWHVVEPSTELEWNWHHQLMCDVLQAMFVAWDRARSDRGRRNANRHFDEYPRNSVFNVPPGSLKSRIISVCYQPWCWLQEPGLKFICLSVNEDASLRDGRMSRDLIKSEWYQRTFQPNWALKTDQDAISNYGNTTGGERLSRASGSEIVGLRADILCLDDPNNPKEAENKLERNKINELFTTNIANRVNDPRRSLRIGVQQRVHSDDWTGYVIKNGGIWSPSNLFGWMHVVLPAEFEPERKFIMPECLAKLCTWPGALKEDPRITPNESIHPTRFTEAYLESEKKRWKNTTQYAGQMQQRPALLEGNLVQRRWFNFFRFAEGVRDDLPIGNHPRPALCHDGAALTVHQKQYAPGTFDFDWVTISVDPAAKKPCHVDGLVICKDRGSIRLGDVNTGDEILTHKGRYRKVLSILERPKEPIIEINTARNRTIRVTPTHAMLTQRGWVNAGELTTNDVLAEVHPIEPCKGSGNITKEEARLLGYIIGDGCLVKKNSAASITNMDEELLSDFEYCVTSLGFRHSPRYKYAPRLTSEVVMQPKREVDDWIIRHDLYKKGSYEKRVPRAVFEAGDEIISEFIAAYWACDGCLHRRSDGNQKNVLTCLNSVSKELLEDVQHLLARLGLSFTLRSSRSSFKTKKQGATHLSWRLAAANQDTVAKFIKLICPLMRHEKRDRISNVERNAFDNILVPDPVISILQKEPGDCRCLEVSDDHSFVYQNVAVHNTEKGSQYGLLCIAGKGGRRFVLDDRSQRGAFHEIIDIMKDMIRTWNPDSILIEPKAAGPDIMDTLREQMYSGDVPMVAIEEAEPGNSDKEMRLQSCLNYLKNGAVYLLDGAPWLGDFVEEITTFPNFETDDRTDSFSQCLNQKREMNTELPDW